MYVETDLLLALAKSDDWLKAEAEALIEADDRRVETSRTAFLEFMLVADRYEFDTLTAVSNLLDLVDVVPESDAELVLRAALYRQEEDMTTFDAMHAAIAEERRLPICSSDRAYEGTALTRVPLEPRE